MEKIKILILVILLMFSTSVCFSYWQEPVYKIDTGYRYDLRHPDKDIYFVSLQASLEYEDLFEDLDVIIRPFVNFNWNQDRNIWEHKELAVALDVPLTDWFTLTQDVRASWYKEDMRNYGIIEKEYFTESATTILLKHVLLDNTKLKLEGFFANTYLFNLDKGEATRNELCVGFIFPVNEHFKSQIDWRHIDRIHYYDSDTLEALITWEF
ncbi:MAG: hypothetical protein P9L96_05700 [Candidatus Gygaella obscura]|nr:hypothetical protein [Candidatus Gygaella obscura]